MHWPPPLRVRMPEASKDYTELGQDERPEFWIPALVGLAMFMVILLVATLLGKI